MDGTLEKMYVAPSPHIRDKHTTQRIMADVLIALLPAAAAAVYFYGASALLLMAASVAAAVLAEYVWQKANRQRVTVSDLSAAVTGLLLAFNMPASAPVWMPVIGAVFAIIIVKQLFGGLGHNFINPALAARGALMASWPSHMTSFVMPGADAVSSATPLGMIKEGAGTFADVTARFSLTDVLTGRIPGCLGEVSAVLLLAGGIYLIARKVIQPRIPVAMLGSMIVMLWIFGGEGGLFSASAYAVLYQVACGGAVLGAVFMATDYATTPVTPVGQWIFGAGAGVLAVIIRLLGTYPEGVSYAILLMNVAAPLIEKLTRPTPFGVQKPAGKKAGGSAA
ncbi:MAG: RnfABCDGE type electron transport complex subunit D [Peptococcaceae bacterium]|jgi:electron transport complex protein RnfD|nr:RnfABCDGE type electron transport complex subunit D [Peptococcaceae bacterium]